MFTIRNFGNDCKCASLNELKEILTTTYLGCDVSIQYRKPSGMLVTHFVSVSSQGVVSDSYQEGVIFNWHQLAAYVVEREEQL
jgi:hypothetical protein